MDMLQKKRAIEVLNEEDLKVLYSKDIYKNHLQDSILSSAESIEKALDEFYTWLRLHKGQLDNLYIKSGYSSNMIKSDHYFGWMRQKFYIWKTNMSMKDIRSEIDILTQPKIEP